MTKIKRTRGRLPQRITVKMQEKGISGAATEESFNEWKNWLQGKVEEQKKRKKVFYND